jgi:hypothetical protein
MSNDTRDEQLGVRELARQGLLADTFEQASATERRRLRREAYELLHPVVFGQLTCRIEARRGHRDCMASISRLRPDCLDRFYDDMDAVLDDLFHHARKPIHNLEGWVSSRLIRATVDAYRRRRGSRGALQRPRIPRWLARKLYHDGRLLDMAIQMLEWVGVDATAGADDWPIEAWFAQRATETGDYEAARRAVVQDVATVIAAMRTNARWYRSYVERPMGHKRFPLTVAYADGAGTAPDQPPTALDASAVDDARRVELAALAVALITARVERGGDVRAVVVDVIATVFGSGTAAEVLDRMPGQGGDDSELIEARLADPRTVDRIIAVVLELLEQ